MNDEPIYHDKFHTGPVEGSIRADVVLDLNKDGHLVGVEVLHACMPEAIQPDEIFPADSEPIAQPTVDSIMKHWPQARAELAGFAKHLERNHSEITAIQIRMAVALADREFARIQAAGQQAGFPDLYPPEKP